MVLWRCDLVVGGTKEGGGILYQVPAGNKEVDEWQSVPDTVIDGLIKCHTTSGL